MLHGLRCGHLQLQNLVESLSEYVGNGSLWRYTTPEFSCRAEETMQDCPYHRNEELPYLFAKLM